jgi:membrane protease YdiL (CAAX protease family)
VDDRDDARPPRSAPRTAPRRASRRTAGRTSGLTSRDRADVRRFVLAVVGFAVLFTAVGRIYGEDIALELQNTPTTTLGWRFIGWMVSAPPAVLTMITWHERRPLRPRQRRDRSLLLAGWIGLSMFVLPARTASVDSQFGTGALVGDPLSAGWAWGALAAVIGLVFTGLVLLMLFRTVDVPTLGQRDLTVRFLERAWLVLLVVSLGFALYGARTEVFHGGS